MNHAGVRVWEADIRRVVARQVLKSLGLKKGGLDLLAGCPPCQAFSSLRTLNGRKRVRDRDKDLLFEFLRFARVLSPKAILLENVPGLAHDPRLDRFRASLRRLGYSVAFRVVDAAQYGVPQRRRRLLLLASRVGSVSFAKPASMRRTVRTALHGIGAPGFTRDPLHNVKETRSQKVASFISRIPKDGGSRADLGADAQLDCHTRCDGFSDVYGRMSWDKVSPTITSGCVNPSKGRFLHPSEDRCITLREAALLQTFPKSYRFSLDRGKFDVARMIGNALPPELVRRQALVIHRDTLR